MTHFRGYCINHLFIPSELPLERLFVNAIPTEYKDHAILVGGSLIKEWEFKSKKKVIPDYLIKDKTYIRAITKLVGKYEGDQPFEYLKKIKETAWKLAETWKDNKSKFKIFKELWRKRNLVKRLKETKILRKPNISNPYSSDELKLMEEVIPLIRGENRSKNWRKKIIKMITRIVMKQGEILGRQMEIVKVDFSIKTKEKKSTSIKGVFIDGIIKRDGKEIRKSIKEFWGNLLGTKRKFDKKTLDNLLGNHKPCYLQIE